jgi:hypothetical protein
MNSKMTSRFKTNTALAALFATPALAQHTATGGDSTEVSGGTDTRIGNGSVNDEKPKTVEEVLNYDVSVKFNQSVRLPLPKDEDPTSLRPREVCLVKGKIQPQQECERMTDKWIYGQFDTDDSFCELYVSSEYLPILKDDSITPFFYMALGANVSDNQGQFLLTEAKQRMSKKQLEDFVKNPDVNETHGPFVPYDSEDKLQVRKHKDGFSFHESLVNTKLKKAVNALDEIPKKDREKYWKKDGSLKKFRKRKEYEDFINLLNKGNPYALGIDCIIGGDYRNKPVTAEMLQKAVAPILNLQAIPLKKRNIEE